MKTFRIITIVMGILLVVGCAPTAEQPTATVEVVPTDTVAPTATATAVPSPTFTPQPTNTATPLPTNTPKPTTTPTPLPSPTPTTPSISSEPFHLDYLVTAPQLNLLTQDMGIIEWQVEGADLEWENRLCRTFLGVSWSISPNVAINCIFKGAANVKMDQIVEWLFENEILYASAFPLEPTLVYDTEYVLYADQYDNGQSVFDGFLLGDGVLYWASISVGTPGGYTPQMVFDEFGKEIETLLHAIFMINLDQSESEAVTESDWANSQLVSSQNSYEAGEFEEAFTLLQKGVEAAPEMSLKTFEEQVLADPENGFAYFGRGVAHLYLENMEDAFADLSEAILLADEDLMAQYYYLVRGYTYAIQADFENATSDWEQATTINPNNADAIFNIAMAYEELNEPEAAVQNLLTILTLDVPTDYKVDVANRLINNAEFLLHLCENQEQARFGLDVYKSVIAELPEFTIPARHLNNLCWNASLWGLAEDVMFACETAVAMEPEHGSYQDSRGLAKALTGDFEGAIEDFNAYIIWQTENDNDQEEIALREAWIAALEAGSNPFDEETLAALRNN
ncbi:MAG: tetratricopeptide repeat protein [Ardenticatenaceae bacterium]|nr:tetratricopeptide repeat protein [Ardenticatenaceae bacterium]MCB8988587.1 tetratricopeptide repeat protein [Ardenticatenaceae bacterium]